MQTTLPEGTVQLPPQFSTLAPMVDEMYMLIYWVSVVFTVGVVLFMFYFMWKYRRRPGVKATPTGHSTALELVWALGPLVLLVPLFHYGFTGYMYGAVAPEDAIDIRVRGQQWVWEFEHRNGVIAPLNQLLVPVDTPVRLIMSSADVLHSFFIPTMRVKRDVVPGMYTTLWFESTVRTDDIDDGHEKACQADADCPEGFWCGGREGDEARVCVIPIFCAEYCGAPHGITQSAFDDPDGPGRNTNHSTMMADLTVTSLENYDRLIADGPPPPDQCMDGDDADMGCWGEQLYQTSGCVGCHSTDGSPRAGPTWGGLWGATRTFETGSSCEGDADYITESILQPQARIVEGFSSVNMPPYRFSERQLEAIVTYIQTLSE